MKHLIMTLFALSLTATLVIAEDAAQDRTPGPIHTQTPVPPASVSIVDGAPAGTQVTPVIQAEFVALEAQYQQQIDELAAQLDLVAPEQRDAIQQQVSALKAQHRVARLELSLQMVRASGDTEAEARILARIAAMNAPAPQNRTHVARDPVTGVELQGGAK